MEKHHPVIAVVDDDLPIVELLEEVLSDADYAVRPVDDINTALQEVQQIAPDLLILDLHLQARVSGLDILAQLRSAASTAALPVILYTADSQRARELATQYHTPPTWCHAPRDLVK